MYFFFLSVVLLIQTEKEKPTIVNKRKIKQKKNWKKKKRNQLLLKTLFTICFCKWSTANEKRLRYRILCCHNNKIKIAIRIVNVYATLWYLCFLFYFFFSVSHAFCLMIVQIKSSNTHTDTQTNIRNEVAFGMFLNEMLFFVSFCSIRLYGEWHFKLIRPI